MGLDNQDVLVEDADDVSLDHKFYYEVTNLDGDVTEKGYVWLVQDYAGWKAGDDTTYYTSHPRHCGIIKENGKVRQYPDFMFHYDKDEDIDNQCNRTASDYQSNNWRIPFNFAIDYSSKNTKSVIKDSLHSSYSRVPNGSDSDDQSDFQVADDTPGTTDIKIILFKAKTKAKKIIITWSSVNEQNILGYNIKGKNGENWIKLNESLIHTKGNYYLYSIEVENLYQIIKLEIIDKKNHTISITTPVQKETLTSTNSDKDNNNPKYLTNYQHNSTHYGCRSFNFINWWSFIFIIFFFFVFKKTHNHS